MRACIIALMCLSSCAFSIAHVNRISGSPGRFEDLVLSQEIPDFTMTQGTLFDGLKNLSSGPIPFGLGFEEVLRVRFADAAKPDPHFDLHLRNKTVREILNALCLADPRYTWSADGTTINVYPRVIIDDTSYLLNRRLVRFELNGITDIDQGLLAIVHQLPPPEEQIAHVQMGGDSSYPTEPWKASFQDLSVRQAINQLVAHMGPHACWIFHGSGDFRAFTFLRSGFHEEAERAD
jgi:hypothetical protein